MRRRRGDRKRSSQNHSFVRSISPLDSFSQPEWVNPGKEKRNSWKRVAQVDVENLVQEAWERQKHKVLSKGRNRSESEEGTQIQIYSSAEQINGTK